MNLSQFEVYNGMVYASRSKFPLNGNSPRDATSFELGISLSAVVDHESGGQALVECEESCGIDRYTLDGGREGSEQQKKLMDEIEKFCKNRDLKLLPGVLDI